MIKRALSLIIAAAMLSGIPVYADESSYGAISDDVTLGYSAELLDTDDMTKGSGADWGTWDSSTHTLTLMGDLPDMNEGMLYRYVNNIAVIEKIVILPETKAAGSLKSAFKGLTALKEIEGLSELDTSSVTNMSYVFSGCESLLSLDLSGWDTSEVTTMIGMFAGCSSITSLKLPAGFSVTTAMQLPNNTGGYIGWAKSGTNTVISKSGRFAEFAATAKGEYIRITEQVHQHTYSAPVYLWAENNSSCTAKTVCTVCNENITEAAAATSSITAATCTSKGKTTYTAAFTDEHFTDQVKTVENIPVLPHSYSEPVYTWSENNTSCTAKSECTACKKGITEIAAATSTVSAATCTAKGKTTYTAAFADEHFTDQVKTVENIPVLPHTYSEPVYTWSEDNTACTAKAECTVCKKDITEIAAATSAVSAATCTAKGKTIYTAVFTDEHFISQTKTVENIDMIPHSYNLPEWVWKDDNTADAVFICKECGKKSVVSADISETTEGAAVGAAGKRIITAVAAFGGDTYTDTKEISIPALEAASPLITKIEPGNCKMNITWESVQDAVSYKVYYKCGDTLKYVTRTGTGAFINNLPNGTYDIWVTAVVNGKETAEKNIKTAVLKEYYVPCRTQATESGTIEISWDRHPDALRYRVVCIDQNNNVRDTKTTSKLSFKWVGLHNGETYGFYVQPYIDGVYPTFTRTDEKDKEYIQWTVPVNSPMITKLSLGNQKVWLYYESVPRAKKYYIYVTQDGKERLAGTTAAEKFLVTGLANGSEHNAVFYVKALVDGKLTPLKRPASRWTRDGMKPALALSSGQCVLSWSKYTDCKASAEKYRVVLVDADYKTIASRETANLAFTWKGLKQDVRYGFYVVPYVNGEYIPFGLSHAEDKANVVMFTAK